VWFRWGNNVGSLIELQLQRDEDAARLLDLVKLQNRTPVRQTCIADTVAKTDSFVVSRSWSRWRDRCPRRSQHDRHSGGGGRRRIDAGHVMRNHGDERAMRPTNY
jgi:hypothetical protein